jgi:phage shock protein E
MGLLSLLGIKTKSEKVKELMAKGAIIVDVRTPQEYNDGHIASSLNIPVDQIEARISTLKKKARPVIVCCRTGSRAGRAKAVLRRHDIDCLNGGSWGGLNYLIH